MTVEGGLL